MDPGSPWNSNPHQEPSLVWDSNPLRVYFLVWDSNPLRGPPLLYGTQPIVETQTHCEAGIIGAHIPILLYIFISIGMCTIKGYFLIRDQVPTFNVIALINHQVIIFTNSRIIVTCSIQGLLIHNSSDYSSTVHTEVSSRPSITN